MKADKHLKVSEAILQVIANKGLEGLNISSVAKYSGVSRAWIYQYMGKNRKDLAEIAAKSCGAYFARSNISVQLNSKTELQTKLIEGSEFIIQASLNSPVVLRLYYKYKGSKSAFGDIIEEYEASWVRKFSVHLERVLGLSKEEAQLKAHILLMVRLGECLDVISQEKKTLNLDTAIRKLVSLQNLILDIDHE